MTRLSRPLITTITCIGILMATGCRPQTPQSFTIGGASSFELLLPTLVAVAKGHFKAEGLADPDLTTASGTNIRTSLAGKDLDFGLLAFIHTPLARSKNQPFKIVAAIHEREIFSLVVRQGLATQVKAVSDLKGRTIGITRHGAGAWALAGAYLRQAGLNPETDVKMIEKGDDLAAIYEALRSGAIDAFPAWEPLTTRLIENNVGFALVDISDPAQHQRWVGSSSALSMTLVTREDMIQQRADLVRRVVAAHVQALSDIRTMSGAAIVQLLRSDARTSPHLQTSLSVETLTRIIDRIKGGFGSGRPERSAYEAELRLALEAKLLDRSVGFDEAVERSFVR